MILGPPTGNIWRTEGLFQGQGASLTRMSSSLASSRVQ